MSTGKYSQTQKVAILLLSLGEEQAAEVMSRLPAGDVKRISRALSSIERVDQATVDAVMAEFFDQMNAPPTLAGGENLTRAILDKALGKEASGQIMGSVGLPALAEHDPESLAAFLRHERPQTIALIMAHLDAADFKETLKLLPENLYTEVLVRLAQLDRVDNTTLEDINEALAEAATKQMEMAHRIGGPETAARLINALGNDMGLDLLDQLEETNPELSAKVREHLFTFDDLVRIHPDSMPKFLASIDRSKLLIALKLASPAVMEKVRSSLSSRAREMLDDDFAAQKKIARQEVEAAQRAIAETAQQMQAQDEIRFEDDDEYV